VAADAKIEVDDNAIFRQPLINQWVKPVADELERRAKEIGVTFVDLDGEIGIVASGAGLAMSTMDLIRDMNFSPGNFLETGGGITDKLIAGSVGLVCSKAKVRGLIVNLYGGVNSLTAAARGVVDGVAALPRKIPVVVKAQGNQQEECWRILEEAGIPVVKTHRTEDAVRLLVDSLGGKSI
jgi:succinyl-CoA synthetase beta subunit